LFTNARKNIELENNRALRFSLPVIKSFNATVFAIKRARALVCPKRFDTKNILLNIVLRNDGVLKISSSKLLLSNTAEISSSSSSDNANRISIASGSSPASAIILTKVEPSGLSGLYITAGIAPSLIASLAHDGMLIWSLKNLAPALPRKICCHAVILCAVIGIIIIFISFLII
jgi:hypothetical protein